MIVTKFTFSSRSVSTIVGGLIFLVIITSAFAAFMVMMQTNTDFLRTQVKVSEQEMKKIQEQFVMGAAYDSSSNNRLCVSVRNTGAAPLEMTDVWIINRSSVDSYDANLFDIDLSDAFIPVGSTGQILENQVLNLDQGVYDIKVVTSSGTTKTTELQVFSGTPDPRLNVTAFAYPINAASGQNVTLGMHVYNVANTTLVDVQPRLEPGVRPIGSVPDGFNQITNQTVIPRLDPDEDALFLWDPQIIGGIGTTLNFSVSAKAMVEGCGTSSFITSNNDTAHVKIVPGVRREILASPETFITFPNPFGQSGGTGVFAIAIQNPTNHAFTVPQVSVQLITPDNPNVIQAVTGVTPATGWNAGSGTIIFWLDSASPVTVGPFDVKEFIVRMDPTNTLTESPINSIIFNTYSSFGQFGKGPFTAGSTSGVSTILNVYANTTRATGGAERFIIPDIPSGKTDQRFNFTISNFGDTAISSGSFMLINVPPGLRDLENHTAESGLAVQRFKEFDDGSVQIPVRLSSNLGSGVQRTYAFNATVPTISVPAFYVFTIVANGTTTGGTLLGPLSETVLQVCPTGGC